jgi:hypothetical protein
MLHPVKNINEYKRIKDALKERFDSERTGDQSLFREQSKILQPLIKPLISTQEQTVKAIQDSGTKDLARELQRRNDHVDLLAQQPFYLDSITYGTPSSTLPQTSSPIIKIDLDADLNETDIENLQDMSLDLPSVVFKNKQIEETLDKIKTENRSIGQKLGRGSNASEREKQIYTSQRKTLDIYRQKILGLEGATQFVGKGLKHKNKNDVIFYSSIDDLCSKLAQLCAAKRAGNTGLDNRINSILDELLRVCAVSKDEYDNLYKNIFAII